MANEKPRQGRIVLSLTFTTLITIIFIVGAALSTAYVWGVMSGRHSRIPAPEEPVAILDSAPPPQPEAILKAQELEFVQVLRGEQSKPTPKPVATQAVSGQESPVPQTQETAQPAAAPPVPTGYSDYVFQIAALKDEQSVDGLRQRLEGRGLRTRMEKSGKLLLVLVLLRGDEARAQEVAQIAEELRLGTPLLRSRKPVEP